MKGRGYELLGDLGERGLRGALRRADWGELSNYNSCGIRMVIVLAYSRYGLCTESLYRYIWETVTSRTIKK